MFADYSNDALRVICANAVAKNDATELRTMLAEMMLAIYEYDAYYKQTQLIQPDRPN
jgi:hypothetical protein